MNILYDHYIFSTQKYGGISRYFYELITRLSEKPDAGIALFMGLHISKYGLEDYRNRFNRFFGVSRPEIPRTIKIFTLINSLILPGFANKSCIDIYHQTYYTRYLPRFNGARIVTVHDMIHELYPQYLSAHKTVSALKKWSVERAAGIICVSQSTKRDLIEIFNVPEEKIRVIYHGNSLVIDPGLLPEIKDPYILYVGQRGGYKNFRLLLEAYAKSPVVNSNFKLICFGGGPMQSEELMFIKETGIAGKILWHSGPDRLLANLYKYAAAFIYPSLYEGFGFPPLEAMHYGCPVVVSNRSSIPEVVGKAGLYFEPAKLDDLIVKLEKILSDGDLRKQLINFGYEQEAKYSWDKCAEETYKLYKDTLNTR